MAGTAKTDLVAVTITANDKAGAPLGFDLDSQKAVALNKLTDAVLAVTLLRRYVTDGATQTALDVVITDLG
jgi:hypothetical protein